MAPKIFSINKNGEKINYDVILTFKSEINKQDYVVYTDNTYDEENEKPEVLQAVSLALFRGDPCCADFLRRGGNQMVQSVEVWRTGDDCLGACNPCRRRRSAARGEVRGDGGVPSSVGRESVASDGRARGRQPALRGTEVYFEEHPLGIYALER